MNHSDEKLSKSELRKVMETKRAALKPAARQIFAVTLAQRFLETVDVENKMVACYWPTHHELDTRPLLNRLVHEGVTCCLPVTVEGSRLLAFHPWNEKTPMIVGAHRIPMPDPTISHSVLPDLIIMPLLAFDARGHRLGYGAGYYDQTLAQLRVLKHPFHTIGAAFSLQQVAAIPDEAHDIPMDMVITEEAVINCKEPTS